MKTLEELGAAAAFALLLIGAFLALHLAPAHAAEPRLEFLAGSCQQTRSDKGSWWNDHYPTSIDLTTKCGQIGLSDTPWQTRLFNSTWNAGWRIAYVNLGRITTDSVMALQDSEQFSNPDGSACDNVTTMGCLIRTVGGGTAQGFTVGGLLERGFARFVTTGQSRSSLMFGLEAGLFVYYNRFDIDLIPYPDQAARPVMHYSDANGWLATTYLGANLRYQWAMFSVRGYQRITAHKTGCGGCSGVTKGPAYQINAGVSIPF